MRACSPTPARGGAARLIQGMLLAALLALPPAPVQSDEVATDVASYQIQARLDDTSKQIVGQERISYRNPSQDTLPELYFRLYLNAFRAPDTLWLREYGGGLDPAHPGWTRVDALRLDSGQDLLAGATLDETATVMRVPLPTPLGPGQELRLDLGWTAQLPRSFQRTGFAGPFVFAGQWYPKLAVYDPRHGGWNREPWHGNAEFFADFGSYDLAVTVPSGRVVSASGVPEGSQDNGDGTQTARFRSEHVTDVAWFEGPDLASQRRRVGNAEVEVFAPAALAGAIPRYLDAAQLALDQYSAWYGPYPWPRLAVLVPPLDANGVGGMEYPALVTVDPPPAAPFGLDQDLLLPEVVTLHEIAHQWFPMQVQSDEAAEPWLDEGFADYLTTRLLEQRYGVPSSFVDAPFAQLGYRTVHHLDYLAFADSDVVTRRSWDYSRAQYGSAVYSKGSLALRTLQGYLGEDRMLAALRLYVARWRWRHPLTADFVAAVQDASGEDLGWLFQPLLFGTDTFEYRVESIASTPGPGGYQTEVRLQRSGGVPLPVAVLVRFADGSEQTARWDARDTQATLRFASTAPAMSASIDPGHDVALELNALDDTLFAGMPPTVLGSLARGLGTTQWLGRLYGMFG